MRAIHADRRMCPVRSPRAALNLRATTHPNRRIHPTEDGLTLPDECMKPKPLTQRIEQWFAANPDEQLTYSDMAVKFDIPLRKAWGAVKQIRRRRRKTGATLHAETVVRYGAHS